jgi:DNA/RNA-binding domain of Phe-tRNA-synthetase-like protein
MMDNVGRIELSLDEYKSMKETIKAHELVEAKLGEKVALLQEKVASYDDALSYLDQIGLFNRVFKWKESIKDVKSIADKGTVLKRIKVKK